mmetsp:Transcript_82993/g.234416  ORF Transcript_82993/g.234416 Transcript_82993/m.234416 type:complete len:99 (+) Transcript_82993:616-912(+)
MRNNPLRFACPTTRHVTAATCHTDSSIGISIGACLGVSVGMGVGLATEFVFVPLFTRTEGEVQKAASLFGQLLACQQRRRRWPQRHVLFRVCTAVHGG